MPDTITSPFERTFPSPIETYRQVSTTANRNSIPNGVRWEGMQVYVTGDSTTYELRGGIGNEDWVDIGDVADVIIEDVLTSTVTTNALSANQGRVLDEKFADYLPLDGSQDMSGTLNIVGGGLVCDGTVTCLSLTETSDVKVKKNITSLAMDPKPIKVNWVSFEYKDKKIKGKFYGCIANELEHDHPEFVVKDEDTGLRAVRYTNLLVAKVAELERRIAALERRGRQGGPAMRTINTTIR